MADHGLQCSLCEMTPLRPIQLEGSLRAYQCERCGGIWLAANDYLAWRDQCSTEAARSPAGKDPLAVDDGAQARLCPADGHLMLKYKVGHDVSFLLDRCGRCNGVWLDRNEWEVLKSRNLHGEINSVFTEVWQRQVRQEEHRRALHLIYARKLGAEGYAELQRIKQWVEGHPERAAILAYLNDEDPYRL